MEESGDFIGFHGGNGWFDGVFARFPEEHGDFTKSHGISSILMEVLWE